MKNSIVSRPKTYFKKYLVYVMYKFMWGNNGNNELYFASPYKFMQYCKSYFKNRNYIIGQLRYFGNNLSRTSKQAEIYFMNCILIK